MHMLVLFIMFPGGGIFCPTLYPGPLRGSEALVKEASEPRKGPGYEVVFCQEGLGPLLAMPLIVSCRSVVMPETQQKNVLFNSQARVGA